MTPQALQFGAFVWPNNPERYQSRFSRAAVAHKIPGGGFRAADLGPSSRLHTLSGCFFGAEAYGRYQALETLFRQGGARTLLHPHWPPCRAFMTELTLTQEPTPDYVAYTVTFLEEGEAPPILFGGAPSEPIPDPSSPPLAPPAPEAADGGGQSPDSADKTTVSSSPSQRQYLIHVVVKGDTLWGISQKYKVSLDSMIALNPQIKNPNLIYEGDQVRVKAL